MNRSSPRVVAAIGVAFALAGASPALAANWVIGAGNIDPPYGPERPIGASYSSLVGAWGPPARPAEDIPVATWPHGLEVTLTGAPAGAAVTFNVFRGRWRTPSGARIGTSPAALRRIYGARLEPVADRRGLMGVGRHYMVRAGGMAIGFVMRPGRVAWINTGTVGTVRQELRFAGPS